MRVTQEAVDLLLTNFSWGPFLLMTGCFDGSSITLQR